MKKNQIVIIALILIIAVAGYVGYMKISLNNDEAAEASVGISDDSNDPIIEDNTFTNTDNSPDVAAATETDEVDEAQQESAAETELNPGEAVLTSSTVGNVDFATEMKLNREQVREKNKETLMNIINNTTLTDEQKQAAVDQMVALTDIAERETAAEMILEAKGFTDVVVSITDSAADVVLNMGDVTDAKRAQIEDIVKRKANISPENIIITPIDTGAGTQIESETQTSSVPEATETAEVTE